MLFVIILKQSILLITCCIFFYCLVVSCNCFQACRIKSQLYANFLIDKSHLEEDVKTFFTKLIGSPFRRPDAVGDGLCLTVDAPYNENNACVNTKRPGYFRNNYGLADHTQKTLNEDNVYRFTYGTGSGSVTHGISMRYVLFFS